jgi:hypothetical protein
MRYQVTTPLTPREALEQALADFGPGGLGLQLTSQTNLSVVLQGGGGHIAVTAEPGAKTTLEIETREWDYGVQQFMARVHRRRPWWQRWWRRKATRHLATSVVHRPRQVVGPARGGLRDAAAGFDHGAGHPLLLLYAAKAPYSQKSKHFNGLVHYPSNTLYEFILN